MHALCACLLLLVGNLRAYDSYVPAGYMCLDLLAWVCTLHSRIQQGGVGDCWFLSALAVVAQRHDLIAKLFTDTAPAPTQGAYHLRLFLDGKVHALSISWLVAFCFPVSNCPSM